MGDEEFRNAATAIVEKRRLEAKQLMLSCQRCRDYFECDHFERFCVNCRPAGSVIR
jgi:Zn finger protein HypA/HybF involved in hydrogenase expression